jgi:ubiquinone/menaquinone biosynthesis C-methylase UbiE
MSIKAGFLALVACASLGLSGCKPVQLDDDRVENARDFPRPKRNVAEIVGTTFSTETARDKRNEATVVMDIASLDAGMSVADIGAGEGYYTVRLAEVVGNKGRVLAQDIDSDALTRLGTRVSRERLDNVSIKPGEIADPKLPANSFDRIFMVHMYHEVAEPYAFIWHMRPALRKDGQVIVVDVNRPTEKHGIPPKQLFCEFEAVGYKLMEFAERPDIAGFVARFQAQGKRPDPKAIKACDSEGQKTAEPR